MSSVRAGLRRGTRALVDRWQRSLSVRVVLITLVGALILVGVSEFLLVARVGAGLIQGKTDQSIAEATVGLAAGQRTIAEESQSTPPPTPDELVDATMTTLTLRSESPSGYEVLLLDGFGTELPERGTNLVDPSSVPAQLRESLTEAGGQLWTYTTIRYVDGASQPGTVVGSTLALPNGLRYEAYYLFPFTQVQATIGLVRSTAMLTGGLLVSSLVLLVLLVTRYVVKPVREAAAAAEQLRAGRLEKRLPVHGKDDLAALAQSFNSMAQAIQVQIQQLEDLSHLQQRFVSDVSHELRTPVTTIRMASDVLYDSRDEMSGPVQRANELLHDQLGRFEELLVDLLEISRIDAGATHLETETADLKVLVSREVSLAAPLAHDRGSDLVLHTDGACFVDCDPRRVERIVRNLLSNAIEHGEGRPVDVFVAGGVDQASVLVRDHGRGMAESEQERVFDRFWRGEPSRVRTLGGTGLGLSIALEDARLHGGHLDVFSRPGQGSSFRLTLPVVVGQQVAGPAPLALQPGERGA